MQKKWYNILILLYEKGVKMSRAERTLRLAGKLIKFLFVVFVFSVIFFLLWRAFISTKLPSEVADLHFDDKLEAAIENDGGLSGAFRQEQRSITSTERNYGYFSVEKAVFLPSANELQIVTRYNNSTLRATAEDYELAEPPSRNDDVYDVSLVIVIDKSPENKDDNLTGEGDSTEQIRIFGKKITAAEAQMYNYRSYIFDFGEYSLQNMLADGTLISVFADFYYVQDIDYDREAYGTLCLYDYITGTVPYEPTKNEAAKIEEIISK